VTHATGRGNAPLGAKDPEKRGSPKAGTLRLRGKGLHSHATLARIVAPECRKNQGMDPPKPH